MRPPSRATSITLRSASPRHRDRLQRRRDDYDPPEPTYPSTTLQPAKWDYYPQRSSHFPDSHSQSSHYDYHTTNTWKSWNQGKDYTKSSDSSGWIDYSKPSSRDQPSFTSSTRPITAYSSDQQSTHHQPRRPQRQSGSLQSRASTQLPPGHVAIDLHSGNRQDWARVVKFAMEHPDRMRAANKIPASEYPKASTTMDQEEYEKACDDLQHVDQRIPQDVLRKAVQLLFSVNLLPDYDLSTCYTIELHSTNMIAALTRH